MLDSMTPRQFDEWLAYRRLEPTWQDRLLFTLRRGITALLCAWGSKNAEAVERQLMMPAEREQLPTELSPNQTVQVLGAYVPLKRSE